MMKTLAAMGYDFFAAAALAADDDGSGGDDYDYDAIFMA